MVVLMLRYKRNVLLTNVVSDKVLSVGWGWGRLQGVLHRRKEKERKGRGEAV